jgi:hypothetical protein
MTQPAVGEGTKAEAAYIGGRGTVRGGDQSRGAALVQRDHRGRSGLIRTVRLVGTDLYVADSQVMAHIRLTAKEAVSPRTDLSL